MAQTAAIILAAGQGTRMKSSVPKVIHKLLGKPMLQYAIDVAESAGAAPIFVVVGFGADQVRETIGDDVKYIWQTERLGTGHAVMMAEEELSKLSGDLLVLYGDTPLVKAETLMALVKEREEHQAAASILTVKLEDGAGYGRIIRNDKGSVLGIVEAKDATPEQLKINEVNAGIYSFEISELLKALKELAPNNAQGEYYLTDVIKIFAQKNLEVVAVTAEDAEEMMGPNDRVQLAQTEKYLRNRINREWMLNGVTICDPENTYIGSDVEIGKDTIIYPGSFLLGKTIVGENCSIGPQTMLTDAEIGSGTNVRTSQIIQSKIGENNDIGPFSYVRPGTVTANRVKIGDFVEVKNCNINTGSKVPHLTYLGDSDVGSGVNIGAGTITCNYDGVNKFRTTIKDEAFIGSNSNLVAPVVVGKQATVAAGSTITKEVPDGTLGVARSQQTIKSLWKSARQRASEKKEGNKE